MLCESMFRARKDFECEDPGLAVLTEVVSNLEVVLLLSPGMDPSPSGFASSRNPANWSQKGLSTLLPFCIRSPYQV